MRNKQGHRKRIWSLAGWLGKRIYITWEFRCWLGVIVILCMYSKITIGHSDLMRSVGFSNQFRDGAMALDKDSTSVQYHVISVNKPLHFKVLW